MSDGMTHGARATDIGRAYAEYYLKIAEHLERGGAIRRHRSLRDAAQSLDDILNNPPNRGMVVRLTETISQLRTGDKVVWGRFLASAHEYSTGETFARLKAQSPFKGKTLAFVDQWNSGEIKVSGEFTDALSSVLQGQRRHQDRYREQFVVELEVSELSCETITRLPRDGE